MKNRMVWKNDDYVTTYAKERIKKVNETLASLKGGMLNLDEENQLRACRELLQLKVHPLDCAMEGTRKGLEAKINKILGETKEDSMELQSIRVRK